MTHDIDLDITEPETTDTPTPYRTEWYRRRPYYRPEFVEKDVTRRMKKRGDIATDVPIGSHQPVTLRVVRARGAETITELTARKRGKTA
jgi:hypothetical protein